MMTRLRPLALAAVLFFGLSGCDKFLDVQPRYVQDAENYFQNESDYEQALIGAYDLLQGSFINVWIGEIASDNSIAGGETAGIPFAAWIADRLMLPMQYVRKKAKGFGRNAQIEGDFKNDSHILLVVVLCT